MKVQYANGRMADENGNSLLDNLMWNSFSEDKLRQLRTRLAGQLATIDEILENKYDNSSSN